MKTKRVAIYARVSTDGQTIENQTSALGEVAVRRGWNVVETYAERGVSGAKRRDQRPVLDQMLKDAQRGRFDIVMVWSLDRFGRSVSDLCNNADHLAQVNVDLYVDQQNIDTTTAHGKLVFHITAAFAEFERSIIVDRVRAGLKRAKAQGKRLGRPKVAMSKEQKVKQLLAEGYGIRRTAKEAKCGVSVVQRIANAKA